MYKGYFSFLGLKLVSAVIMITIPFSFHVHVLTGVRVRFI